MAAGVLIHRLLLFFLISEVKYSSVFPTSGVLGVPESQTVPELTSNDFDQPKEDQISPLSKLVKAVLKRPSKTNVYKQPSMIQHHQEPQNPQTERAIRWLAGALKPKDDSLDHSGSLLMSTETSPNVYKQPSMIQHHQEPQNQQTERAIKWLTGALKPKDDSLDNSRNLLRSTETSPNVYRQPSMYQHHQEPHQQQTPSNTGIGSIIKSFIGTSKTTENAELPTSHDQDDFGSGSWLEHPDVFSYPYEEVPTYDRLYPNVHLDLSLPSAPSLPHEVWNLQRLFGMINPFKQGLLQTVMGQPPLFNPAGPLHFNANPAYPFQQYPCPHARVSMYHPAHFPQQAPPFWPTLQHGQRQYYHPLHSSTYHFPRQFHPQHHFASPAPPHYGPQYYSPQEHNRRMFMRCS